MTDPRIKQKAREVALAYDLHCEAIDDPDIEKLEELIVAALQSAVAEEREECAKHRPHIYSDYEGHYLGCECGWKTYGGTTWQEHILCARGQKAEETAKERK